MLFIVYEVYGLLLKINFYTIKSATVFESQHSVRYVLNESIENIAEEWCVRAIKAAIWTI